MTCTWVICGAGRRVGKTHLAQKLCAVLPNAVCAKQGCSTRKPDKPENFFQTDADLAAFLDSARQTYSHVLVESNELARQGHGDVVIFVDGIPGQTDYRPDADLLRSQAHLHTGPSASAEDWQAALRSILTSAPLRDAVCHLLADQQRHAREAALVTRHVEPLRISANQATPVRDPGHVVVEELLTIMVEGVGSFALMCTPCDVKALAIGFAFSEGLLASIDDCLDFSYRPEQNLVGLRLDNQAHEAPTRNLIVTSSCGLCGSRNIDKLMSGSLASGDSLRVPAALLRTAVQEMHARQRLFAQTGGTHAAGVFSAVGQLVAFGEDIGRHNAVDKAIGQCLLDGRPPASHGLVLSGRVSLELVAKAARAGIEIIAAVSAPSSLAIDAADRCNITLCAFVRDDRATVYTHPHRIAAP